jgi:diamine N-acetyltransferase
LDCPQPELDDRDVCQLQKIYVQKAFLDKKIGHLLLNAAMDVFWQNDARRIWLTVLESNARAIRFYEKNGWAKHAKHRHQIGE